MSNESPFTPPSVPLPKNLSWRKRKWFLAGFLIVFVGMLLLVNQSSHVPGALARLKLWQYYFVEFRRALGPQTLGPATGSGPGAVYMLFLHFAASCIGGLVAMGCGSILHRRKRRLVEE